MEKPTWLKTMGDWYECCGGFVRTCTSKTSVMSLRAVLRNCWVVCPMRGRSLLRVATFILGDIHQIEPKGVGVNEFDDGFYYTLGLVGSFGSGMVSA